MEEGGKRVKILEKIVQAANFQVKDGKCVGVLELVYIFIQSINMKILAIVNISGLCVKMI